MATVTGLTKDRMLAIEAASVVDGEVAGDNLVLTKHDGSTINAGNVRGPQGLTPTNRAVSSTSVAIESGSKTFALSPAMPVPFAVGSIVRASATLLGNNVVGEVTAASATSVTIDVSEIGGSGTYSSWVLTLSGFRGAVEAHTHSANQTTSGIFPILRGGTGSDTPEGARANLGLISDPIGTTAGLRTLGPGGQQASPGNHSHVGAWTTVTLRSGWSAESGDAPQWRENQGSIELRGRATYAGSLPQANHFATLSGTPPSGTRMPHVVIAGWRNIDGIAVSNFVTYNPPVKSLTIYAGPQTNFAISLHGVFLSPS